MSATGDRPAQETDSKRRLGLYFIGLRYSLPVGMVSELAYLVKLTPAIALNCWEFFQIPRPPLEL